MDLTRPVLVLGADGFIGRHLAFALRDAGFKVIASARRPERLAQMGFQTLAADLTDPATHDPAFWRKPLADGAALVNAAGLLTGTSNAFQAVHLDAPAAAYASLTGPGILISATGIEADTDFARIRRDGERLALQTGKITILRPGLVLADSSYGGSSLLRALAAFPVVTPLVGNGDQPFNPIHADDLAGIVIAALSRPADPGPHPVGGPERISQSALINLYRNWLGLPQQRPLRIPLWLAQAVGHLGDALRMAPISATAVAQLEAGVLAADTGYAARLGQTPRPVSRFVTLRPAGTQDLWHARLYLLRPLLRLILAFLWLASGLAGLFLPPDAFLPIFADAPVAPALLVGLARAGGLVDLAISLALLRNWQPKRLAVLQLLVIAGYTLGLSTLAPALWLAPMGDLVKNLPIAGLVLVTLAIAEER